jgi:hypothetical protein
LLALLLLDAEAGGSGGVAAAFVFFRCDAGGLFEGFGREGGFALVACGGVAGCCGGREVLGLRWVGALEAVQGAADDGGGRGYGGVGEVEVAELEGGVWREGVSVG